MPPINWTDFSGLWTYVASRPLLFSNLEFFILFFIFYTLYLLLLRSFNLRTRSSLSSPLSTGGNRQAMTQVLSTGAFFATPAGQPGSIASLNLGPGSTGAFSRCSRVVHRYTLPVG